MSAVTMTFSVCEKWAKNRIIHETNEVGIQMSTNSSLQCVVGAFCGEAEVRCDANQGGLREAVERSWKRLDDWFETVVRRVCHDSTFESKV